MPNRSFRFRVLAVLLLAAPLLGPTGWAQRRGEQPQIDPNLLNEDGVRATKQNRYEEAVEAFRKAYLAEPNQDKLVYNYFTSLVNYSIFLAENGNASAAIEACSQAISLVPREIIVASNLAIFFNNEAVKQLEQGDFNGAIQSIENSQEVVRRFQLRQAAEVIDRTHARIYLMQGREWFKKEDVKNALEAYDKCLRINPQEVEAYLDRSRIYWEQGAFKDAVTDLEEVLRIRGEGNSPNIEGLINRIKLYAQAAGQPITDQSEFFVPEMSGGDQPTESKIRRLLRDVRLRIARTYQINPQTEIHVKIDANQPLIRASEWIDRPAVDFYGESFSMGISGVDPESRDFREALTFNYVLTLLVNVGGREIPYWFAVGMAQYMISEESHLSIGDITSLLAAAENNLLLGTERLTWKNLENMNDTQTIRQANLESIGLVEHLAEILREEGLGTLLKAVRDGLDFNDALTDITNMTPEQIEEEWKNSL
ncbi:MAG: tetratricopeptide repeat protein [Candidatus Omnitrophica bacterium]|nr:tetratricopeptide repeat protein [Candidatus Omnitrophota bacterium]